MQCFVYKGVNKDDHFLYLPFDLAEKAMPNDFPQPLLTMLGELSFVLEFELTPERKLANAQAEDVLGDIERQGFYLQMPKEDMFAEEERLFN